MLVDRPIPAIASRVGLLCTHPRHGRAPLDAVAGRGALIQKIHRLHIVRTERLESWTAVVIWP